MSNQFTFPSKLIDELNMAKSILVLTGAGVSAESGIPTFRGEEGYWMVNSHNYFPEELATYRFFKQMPEELWKWYQHRQKICLEAKPNEGHYAITKLEKWAGINNIEIQLITQNVDNLHTRAGTKKIIEIHGNIFKYRCTNEFAEDRHAFDFIEFDEITSEDFPPICIRCNSILRPHVLWFDEFYNEELFKAQSCIDFAIKTDILFVIGTTLATTIPNRIVGIVHQNGKTIIEINPKPILMNYTEYTIPNSSALILPNLVDKLMKV